MIKKWIADDSTSNENNKRQRLYGSKTTYCRCYRTILTFIGLCCIAMYHHQVKLMKQWFSNIENNPLTSSSVAASQELFVQELQQQQDEEDEEYRQKMEVRIRAYQRSVANKTNISYRQTFFLSKRELESQQQREHRHWYKQRRPTTSSSSTSSPSWKQISDDDILNSIDFHQKALCGHFNCLFRTYLSTNVAASTDEYFNVGFIITINRNMVHPKVTKISNDISVLDVSTYETQMASWEWTKQLQKEFNELYASTTNSNDDNSTTTIDDPMRSSLKFRHIYLSTPRQIDSLTLEQAQKLNSNLYHSLPKTTHEENLPLFRLENRTIPVDADTSTSSSTETETTTKTVTISTSTNKTTVGYYVSNYPISIQPVRIIENGIILGCGQAKQTGWDKIFTKSNNIHTKQRRDVREVSTNDMKAILNMILLQQQEQQQNDSKENKNDDDGNGNGNDMDSEFSSLSLSTPSLSLPSSYGLLYDFQVMVDPATGYLFHFDMDRPFKVAIETSAIVPYMNINDNNNHTSYTIPSPITSPNKIRPFIIDIMQWRSQQQKEIVQQQQRPRGGLDDYIENNNYNVDNHRDEKEEDQQRHQEQMKEQVQEHFAKCQECIDLIQKYVDG